MFYYNILCHLRCDKIDKTVYRLITTIRTSQPFITNHKIQPQNSTTPHLGATKAKNIIVPMQPPNSSTKVIYEHTIHKRKTANISK